MKYNILSTGSGGNCTIINDYLMLDCGLSYKKIKKYLKKVKVIFISHEHSDHFNSTTIKQLCYDFPNIKFVVGHFLVVKLLLCGVSKKNIIVLDTKKWYDIGIFKIRLDYLIHDVPNDCIHIEFKNGIKMFYATDTSTIDHIIAKDYDYYFVEANYDTDEEIDEKIRIAKENGEFTYLERVKKTHLSQLQAINWLDKNKKEDSNIIFIHQHIDKENKDE